MVSKRLCFAVQSSGGLNAAHEIEARFRPNGQTLLNRTEWREKEPKSCAVTCLKTRPYSLGDSSPVIVDIEVSYRPKDTITYLGTTKYDGWTVIVLNRSRDGVLLDRNGQPLKDGDRPVELPNEVFQDVEFNELDFGEFIGEFDVQGVKLAILDAVIDEITLSGPWNTIGCGGFIAPHRSRPLKKIILSNAPTDQGVDGFGTHVLNISTATPHLEHVLMEHLVKLMDEFIEGKASIKNFGNRDLTFVELSDSLVDCQPNEHGFGSWLDTLHWYTPQGFLEDLAKRLMAVYSVEVAVIDGKNGGLVLRYEGKKNEFPEAHCRNISVDS